MNNNSYEYDMIKNYLDKTKKNFKDIFEFVFIEIIIENKFEFKNSISNLNQLLKKDSKICNNCFDNKLVKQIIIYYL
jgi:hypothetical protein